jgi:hypothetical protein
LCAVICRLANQSSFAAKMVETIADSQAVVPGRDAFGYPGEVNADERIRRVGVHAAEEVVVQRVDPREAHAGQDGLISGGNRQVLNRGRIPEAPHCKCAHPSLPVDHPRKYRCRAASKPRTPFSLRQDKLLRATVAGCPSCQSMRNHELSALLRGREFDGRVAQRAQSPCSMASSRLKPSSCSAARFQDVTFALWSSVTNVIPPPSPALMAPVISHVTASASAGLTVGRPGFDDR